MDVDSVETGLLPGSSSEEAEDEAVLYAVEFDGMEDGYVKYQTALWVIYSLLLVLAWGFGLLMLLYLPVRRYVLRKEFRARRLYVTPYAIVYKVTRPVPFPFLGVLKKDKYFMLHSVADITIEQGYLQSHFGVYSIRIENVGVRRSASDDVHILGISEPNTFRKVVLTRLSSMRGKSLNQQISTNEDMLASNSVHPSCPSASPDFAMNYSSPLKELILQKLEDVGSYVKRIQTLVERQHPQESGYIL